ncbi:hypothetical protein V6N13_064061 [Hibiscus sabdariffa]
MVESKQELRYAFVRPSASFHHTSLSKAIGAQKGQIFFRVCGLRRKERIVNMGDVTMATTLASLGLERLNLLEAWW